MIKAELDRLIKSLGEKYPVLKQAGVIPGPLTELYPGRDLLSFKFEGGLSLNFWRETLRFEIFFVTLRKTMPSTTEYRGELPDPYFSLMTQSDVRAIFGTPVESMGPIKMPQPMGQTGGWDAYPLDQDIYPGKKVMFQYAADMQVNTLVFTLIDKERE
ncbi:DUF6392 family protein [Pseudomonas sp. B21-040]|jgi:hypothetical protein|uniref:DUF6392 family protein n=1 Tax=unclassified Pseudomonas TaxID=196821 RepID=UPI001CBD89FC|nr:MULTISPECIES: DUF6392 family protein [unclassified Pseudomonas]UVL41856.1 DUF6392 family protein [Pseudomonas sp. B21-040]